MYLCSLCPEQTVWKLGPLLETSVIGQWVGTLVTEHGFPFFQNEEFVFTFRAGSEVVTFKTKDIPDAWTFWIPLLNSGLVTVRPVFHQTISPQTFHCIRLDFICEQTPEYSLRYFKHETTLSNVLSRVCVYVEGPATLPAKHTLFSTKKRIIEDVYDGIPLVYGSHLDYVAGFITERKPKLLSVSPIHIITGHSLTSKVSALWNLIGSQNALIVTDRPDYFVGSHVLNKFRLTKEELVSNHIFILDKRHLKEVFREQDRDLKCFAEILGLATNTNPSLSQVRRYLWNAFWYKQQTASASIANIVWPFIVEDGPCDLESFVSQKRIHLLEHDTLRGRWPSISEVATIYNETNPHVCKATFPLWSQYVVNLDLPKQLLRKLKVRVVHVRPTLSETRYGLFEVMPFPKEHALLRLAPVSLDKHQVTELVKQAYSFEPASFASLVSGLPFRGSEAFTLEAIQTETSCMVCQDPCLEQRTVTLCGHSYCHDCSLQVFADSIRTPKKTSECPYCREALTCGDIFTLGTTAKNLSFSSKRIAVVPKTTVIDEDGLLGSVQVFRPSDKYTLVSVKAVQPLLQKLLAHAATTTGIKLVALVGPKDTYITELLQVLH